jgi:lipopolysaccharide/colanic/teichoic acid biosynthesis glycosyltransferase
MSLVGPRPPLPAEVLNYDVRAFRRLTVKPGVTCLWQVSGRSDVSFDEWIELDNQYIDNWSLELDIRILAATVPAVFRARGAY